MKNIIFDCGIKNIRLWVLIGCFMFFFRWSYAAEVYQANLEIVTNKEDFQKKFSAVKIRNEKIKTELEEDFLNALSDGLHIAFVPSTSGARITSVGSMKDKKYHGKFVKFRLNINENLLRSVMYYQNGVLDGIATFYDSFGKEAYTVSYVDGKAVDEKGEPLKGEVSFYHISEGYLRRAATFVDGIQEGVFYDLYPDGEVQYEGYMVNGLRDGPFKEYDDNGNIYHTSHYVNGIIHGDIFYYTPYGYIKEVIKVENGVLVDQ